MIETMGSGKDLTSEEKAAIVVLQGENLSERDIAQRIKRSKTAIHNFLTKRALNVTNKRPGRKSSMSKTLCRALVRRARKGFETARTLGETFSLPVGVRRVQQILNSAEFCEFEKRKVAPKLTPAHKVARLEWTSKYIAKCPSFWRGVVFSDEKRFCLDGPDGVAYYWADPRIEEEYFSKRPNGGGGWMVWAGISHHGKTPMYFVEDTMNSDVYIDVLGDNLMPLIEDVYWANNRTVLFQQDNAACHTSKKAMDWFFEQGVAVLPWPAKSPDMNVIEHVWAILVKRVYHNYRQFESRADLKEALTYEWEKLEMDTIRNLISSMPRRLADCVLKRGGTTRYA